MNKFTKEEITNFIIGIIVLGVCLLCIAVFQWQHTVWKDAEDTDYTLLATFNRTDGLVVGDKVRMAGIDIGYVEKSVLDDNFRATLTMKVRQEIKIPDDSSAAIVSSGFMGNKYVEIEPGGSEEYLSAGDEFSYTQDAIILEELIDRIISLGKAKRKQNKQITETNPKEITNAQETD